jgi:type IV secretory pathway TraG/TraD family ATPase VirD4
MPAPAGNAFSIREWVSRCDDARDDSWLFITSRSDMHAVMKPYLALWLQLALMQVTTLKPVASLRLLFFLDELYSAGKLEALHTAMTEGRKYGVGSFIGFQTVAQLVEINGREGASNLLNGAQTKLLLRVEDDETARRCADLLSKAEIEETTEGLSFGLEPERDGSNVSRRRQERHIVMPSELMYLPDLTGYLKLAGDYPVARVQIAPRSYPGEHPEFVQREGLLLDRPSPASAEAAADDAGFDFLSP